MSHTILRCLRNALLPQTRRNRTLNRQRLLQHEQLEQRCVLTLPLTQTFAEGEMIVYNGPSVDLVNDTPFVDAFIDFAGDVDSFYFAPQFTGSYTIDVGDFGNTVDPEVAVYIASTGARVGYNDDLSIFNDDARLILNLTADVRYIIAVADSPNTTTGDLSIVVTAPRRTGSALMTPDPFGDATVPVLLDVPTDIDYFSITAPADATGRLTIFTEGSTFDQRLALFNSAGTLLQGPLVSIAFSGVVPGQEYRIAVYSNDYATSGSLDLVVNFANSGAVVTNTLDAGPGSLRQAILDANAHRNTDRAPDRIRFAIPGVGPHTISLASALPDINDEVDIDGGTQPGTGTTPRVAIDGAALTGGADGLRITADRTSIRMLNIRSFPSDGIQIQANSVLVENSTIGTDWGGVAAFGNANYGIRILNRASNKIRSNVLSGNAQAGIAIIGNAADSNTLESNTIGARFGGNAALPNGDGVVVTDGDSNVISNNVISGNTLSGIVFSGSANTNSVAGNKVGIRSSGNVALPNGGDGILVQSSGNSIGGNSGALRNVISGNARTGILISGVAASNNVIEGNRIGTNLNGSTAIPNGRDGIRIVNASNTRIGSATDALARNVISGNTGSGVTFSQAGSTGGLLVGNFIGVAANGTSALGNAGNGVLLANGATNIQIGGSTGLSQNVVSANGVHGIAITTGSNNNRVTKNRIGTTLSGARLGNTGSGVFIQSSGNTIGGVNASFGNTIGGNAQGITLSGGAAAGNTIAFNTIGTDTASNGSGVQFVGGASSNTLGPGNTIRRNEFGVTVSNNSTRNRITKNSIAENLNLGIDLFPGIQVTANDAGDADVGGNQLQNSPAFSGSPLLIGANLEISFRVASTTVNSAYPLTVEFFVSDGSGEGATFLASTVFTAANFAAGVKTVSFTGIGTGLAAGTTRIVAVATDLNGNSSEFSAQRALAAGGARLSASVAAVQKTGGSLDVNRDGVLNHTDAVQLISFLSSTSDGRGVVAKSGSPAVRYDASGDGLVSPLDVLLVVRGLRKNSSANQAVPSVKQLEDIDFWNSVLSDLDVNDLTAIEPALSKSKWLKQH